MAIDLVVVHHSAIWLAMLIGVGIFNFYWVVTFMPRAVVMRFSRSFAETVGENLDPKHVETSLLSGDLVKLFAHMIMASVYLAIAFGILMPALYSAHAASVPLLTTAAGSALFQLMLWLPVVLLHLG